MSDNVVNDSGSYERGGRRYNMGRAITIEILSEEDVKKTGNKHRGMANSHIDQDGENGKGGYRECDNKYDEIGERGDRDRDKDSKPKLKTMKDLADELHGVIDWDSSLGFERYLEKTGEEHVGLMTGTGYKSINMKCPNVDIVVDLVRRVKRRYSSVYRSRVIESAILGFGFNKLYYDIKAENDDIIYKILNFNKKLVPVFGRDLTVELPVMKVDRLCAKSWGGRRATIHCDYNQHCKLLNVSEELGVPIYELSLVSVIYTLNVLYRDEHYENNYAMFYASRGYIADIKKMVERYGNDLVEYLVKIKPSIEQRIEHLMSDIGHDRWNMHLTDINEQIIVLNELKGEVDSILKEMDDRVNDIIGRRPPLYLIDK